MARQHFRHHKKLLLLFGLPFIIFLFAGGAYALFLGGTSGTNPSTSINLQKGLVGYWQLNGNAKDSTPYSNNGTITGATPTTGPNGQSNGAMEFNASSYIAVANQSIIKPAQTMTASIWVNPTNVGGGLQKLISTTEGGGYALDITGNSADGSCPAGTLCFLILAGSGYEDAQISKSSLPSNSWSLVTGTYNGTTVSLYLNGALVASASATGAIKEVATPLCIGDEATLTGCNGGCYLSGSLSGARIYNRALNPNEVTALYNEAGNGGLNIDSAEAGLVGEWKLNGNAKDSTPYSNNGVLEGSPTPTTGPQGQTNGAYSFNGTSNDISIPNNAALNPTTAVTVVAWVQGGTQSGSNRVVAKNGSSTPSYDLFIAGNGSFGSRLTNSSGTSNYYQPSPTNLGDGNWHQIAMTYNSANHTVTLYKDGSAIGSSTSTISGTLAATTSNLTIGYSPIVGNYFDGSISDVRIYNQALTASQITNLYQAGTSQIEIGGSGLAGSTNLTQGLVGYWPFTGNAKDATPYSDNGTVNGATLTTDRFGNANSAYSFNGTSNSIKISSANLPTSAISVSAWVRASALPTSGGFTELVSNSWDGIDGSWLLFYNSSGLPYFGVYPVPNVEQYLAACPAGSLTIGVWHHLVGTYDGSTVKLYLDGTLCPTTAALSGATLGKIGIPLLGVATGGAAFVLDDVRIYNRALSPAEIQALYNLDD